VGGPQAEQVEDFALGRGGAAGFGDIGVRVVEHVALLGRRSVQAKADRNPRPVMVRRRPARDVDDPAPAGRQPEVGHWAVLDAQRSHDEWQVSDRRYLSEASMALLTPPAPTALPTRTTDPGEVIDQPALQTA
jgi:hypothetical protein